ncbi:thymidine kinase 2, mitochondrial-like [Plakobranchus ocellatus]|uniref:Thymidine kinase 2, mitochondrial-like n=1 Tax=Plakobranchus ocellatus TaxID=259542 RepID=A0AAV3Z4T3_9GAST|nr:thymidine kinase 2, mitochondrial-like [Plakobranchus ocellatus]
MSQNLYVAEVSAFTSCLRQDLMYKDALRWSSAFELLATISMLRHHQNSQKPHTLKMLERSIYSTRHCFMENLRENQLIPSVDYSILKEYHKWVDQHEDIQVDLIVYLRASPEICAERMRKRNRSEEAGVPLEYLQALHRLHDDWLLHGKRGKLPSPVLVLDANKDLSELQQEVAGLSQDILCGMTCVPKDEETVVTS